MATKNIKLKPQEENLSEANIKKVISLLEPTDGSKPITKTLACQILCISYNTKRLDTILSSYKEQQAFRARKMKENRGKPATREDINYIVKEYMQTGNVAAIARGLYRGTTFVTNVLEENSVPIKPRVADYFKPEMIPDDLVAKTFEVGEIVYSARYDSLAKVKWAAGSKDGDNIYNIFLLDEKHMQHAYQPASELAKLDKLREAGVAI